MRCLRGKGLRGLLRGKKGENWIGVLPGEYRVAGVGAMGCGARNYEWLPYRFACFVRLTHFDEHGIMNGFPTLLRILCMSISCL
jgi:hypothetical protein